MAARRAWWWLVLVPGSAWGSATFVSQVPNGSCVACHVSGADLNLFGTSVANHRAARDGGIFWRELYALDADADQYSNGEELGDPCGTWVPDAGPAHTTGITNPGNPASVPTRHTVGECGSSSSAGSSSTGGTSSSAAPSSSAVETSSSSAAGSSSSTALTSSSSAGAASSSSSGVAPDGGVTADGGVVSSSSAAPASSGTTTTSSGKTSKPESRGQDDDPMNPLGGCAAAGLGGLPVLALLALAWRRRRS